MSGLAVGVIVAGATLRKEHPFTMEVPVRQYPVSAIRFIGAHGITGNLLVLFDWGEMCLWELPGCRPSIDGRLDTCYPRNVIEAHWAFYGGEPAMTGALDVMKADIALVPPYCGGAYVLVHRWGWRLVYLDPLAAVLVREPARFPLLSKEKLPVVRGVSTVSGRVPFPDEPSGRAAGV